ncbi:MAG: dTDP-4-dehydrorhamnose 3,5-epimerase [Planctomycetes bacterium]|nr:dTDP-4-dehydrorhamnose 3,5-epimerase [Planctomycetota bacterium]
MEVTRLAIPDLLLLRPKVFADRRGFFFETYRRDQFAALGIHTEFVQDNQSGSVRHTLRGLHYQLHQPQAKLVRVVRGEVYDVAVDLRVGSPWFGRYCGITLSEENRQTLFVPEGFAHGFYVLSDYAEFAYKCSDYYAPEHERGIRWDDPDVGIAWPLASEAPPILSDKDRRYPALAAVAAEDLPGYRP